MNNYWMSKLAHFDFVVITNNCKHVVNTTDEQGAIEAVIELEKSCGISDTKIEKIFVA